MIFPILLIGVLLVFASSCKKDDDTPTDVISFGSFSDPRDGIVYKTITIGNQEWMAENLRYLPSVAGPGTGSLTIPNFYVYDYNGTVIADAKASDNYTTYGVLYNWPAAMAESANSTANPSGVQGVCPVGWHLPSNAEWMQLTDFLGGESVAGGKLKAKTHWISPNAEATNKSGFSALPGGSRDYHGTFYYLQYTGNWWSATEYDANYAWGRCLYYYHGNALRSFSSKGSGFSVRCVKDK